MEKAMDEFKFESGPLKAILEAQKVISTTTG
jgi:hypothetical protein